jgi:hypothetical protein
MKSFRQRRKPSQPQLLVGLGSKLSRVAGHWAAVNQVLPPNFPLVLLAGVERGGLDELEGRLSALRNGVREAELNLKLARAEYERRKRELHGWLRRINIWMRAYVQGTSWWALRRRVPGRGQSYAIWHDAATDALTMWQGMVQNPPDICIGWPMNLGHGETLEKFEALVRSFERANGAVAEAEMDLKIARGGLSRAQEEATALLMAYGHGVRARLGDHATMVDTIPQLWPRHLSRPKADRAIAA